MFSCPKILFLVSLLFVALLNPKFNPYLLFKFLIYIYIYIKTHDSESRGQEEAAVRDERVSYLQVALLKNSQTL